MELVAGKRPIEPESRENKGIVCWVHSKMNGKESLLDLVDSIISTVVRKMQ
jgi:hypothetical protein